MKQTKKGTERKQPRDFGTGQWVTKKYAEKHPDTTVIETITVPMPKKRKSIHPSGV